MTNPDPKRSAALTALALAGTVLAAGLGGCGSEPAPQATRVAAPAPPPPPPPAPSVKSVETLMAELGIDDRVILPEAKAPATTEERTAVLSFFDAFARADSASVKMMVPYLDQQELDALVASGAWEETNELLYAIEIEAGASPEGDKCVLAFFDVDGIQQPQLWYYAPADGGFEFEAQPTPEDVMSFLEGTDLIAAWFDRWQVEMDLASKPDVEIDWSPVDLDESDGSSGGGGFTPNPGGSPSPVGPGGVGRRRPTPPPRRPPGPGSP